MTESEETLLDGVRSWLERGGYVLELEAARIIARQAWSLAQGYHFADPVTGKDREGDIRAELLVRSTDNVHAITLAVECKDTTAPWIFFVGNRSSSAEPWRALRNADIWNCGHCMALFDRIELRATPGPDAYAVAEKRTKGGVDHAYEAVQQAATALVAAYPDVSDDGHHGGIPRFGHAVVVTRSPLVVCTLDDQGNVQLATAPTASVTVPRINLPSDESASQGIQVSVVQLAALEGFIEALVAPPSEREVEIAAELIERWQPDAAGESDADSTESDS